MNNKKDLILVLDFGSQYTQLIARRIRELRVYSLIEPCTVSTDKIKKIAPKGIILSGGPNSVYEKNAPMPDREILNLNTPILGICYGMQAITHLFKGGIKHTSTREYGRAEMYIDNHHDLFFTLPEKITSWMSHGDTITRLPEGAKKLSHTQQTPYAAFSIPKKKIYGVQFHPEVAHTEYGLQIISNFVFRICGCFPSWQVKNFIQETIAKIRRQAGKDRVICGLSGGIDSSVTALLIHKAIGKNLTCIFVNNGLLRKNEPRQVRKIFKEHFRINLKYVNAAKDFLSKLKGITDPEQKRKIIGYEFIRIFENEAKKIKNVKFLGQGTLYPDVIESVPFFDGPTAKIKSHHNVGGLPKKMKLKLIEPLRELFKDEVREIGKELGLPEKILYRHPFPGPGLAVRILGEIDREKLALIKEVDAKIEKIIKKHGLYKNIWQAFAVLLPLKSVGVMGDKRTYEYVAAVRAVNSLDGMTADWTKLPYKVLEELSSEIINKTQGVNRVVFDISSKPPATIEWE